MTFQFKCEQCGKEIEVSVKIMIASHFVELPKDLETATIVIKCPNCGKTGSVSIKLGAMTADRLTRLKFKNARHPCMN